MVETMWTQDAELAWDKLEEKVYTVEKKQEINLGSKFMPLWNKCISRKGNCTY